jgi:hypothetical protein
MLYLWLLVAVAVMGGAVALFSMRRSHDDEHSVEGYHRQLNTLSQIKSHTPGPGAEGTSSVAENALRVGGMRSVRVTDGPPPAVAPPVLPEGEAPIKFDDAGPPIVPSGSDSFKNRDKAMNAMNRRPARLGAPALAVSSVLILIVVLVIVGSHKVPPAHRRTPPAATATSSHKTATHHHAKKKHHSTTPTTLPPVVSLPHSTSHNGATYVVQPSTYSLVLSATNAPCWVDVTNTSTDVTMFEGVLSAGEQHNLSVDGPLTIEVGAPSEFTATINGTAAVLPFGFQTPFTLLLESASAYSSSTTTTTS